METLKRVSLLNNNLGFKNDDMFQTPFELPFTAMKHYRLGALYLKAHPHWRYCQMVKNIFKFQLHWKLWKD